MLFQVDKNKIGAYAGWERYKHNPVLPMEIGETFDATVIEYEGKYRMYFGWRTVRSIAMVSRTESIGPVRRSVFHLTRPVNGCRKSTVKLFW